MAKAPLIEIFSSVQGEGRHVGMPMGFVRVAVCPVRCTYCDTPNSYAVPECFPVRCGDQTVEHQNPMEATAVAELAAASVTANPYGATGWVSITGGEPLLYPAFVLELGTALGARKLSVFLETAALDASALSQCLDAVDHLSADYKLPGTFLAGDVEAAGAQCIACVGLAVERGISVDVKIVLTPDVAEDAFEAGLARLRPLRGGIGLVLQPVTPFGAVDYPCSKEQIARFATLAAEFQPRILPQTHKLLGID